MVQYNGKSTTSVTALDMTSPGFFTSSANGLGQVLAVNQDGSLNSSTNPAQRGSIVTFYATGAGQLMPPTPDGKIISAPLPIPTQPASVRIGGKVGQVLYAGPAPGEVSGVLQINAMIPMDAPTGIDSVYLVLGINSAARSTSLSRFSDPACVRDRSEADSLARSRRVERALPVSSST